MDATIEIGLFEYGPRGLRLLGRSSDAELVDLVRDHLAQRLRAGTLPNEHAPLHVVEGDGGDTGQSA